MADDHLVHGTVAQDQFLGFFPNLTSYWSGPAPRSSFKAPMANSPMNFSWFGVWVLTNSRWTRVVVTGTKLLTKLESAFPKTGEII
jgi:hypothetical protein